MPFDDLDLEFEDEEESKKKKKEAVEVDVDLVFQAHHEAPSRPQPDAPRAQKPQSGGTSPSMPRPVTQAAPAPVKKIEEARAEKNQLRQAPVPKVSGSSALKEDPVLDLESQSIVEIREKMKHVEFEAQVKVAVAEFKTEFLSEMLSDMKLAEHQINQLLIRINAKHPDMRNEVLMIKKILADFTAKKRK